MKEFTQKFVNAVDQMDGKLDNLPISPKAGAAIGIVATIAAPTLSVAVLGTYGAAKLAKWSIMKLDERKTTAESEPQEVVVEG